MRMRQRIGCRAGEVLVLASGASFWRMGRTKPAVLPVPVWAPARRSLPPRIRGMACSCTGVGIS